MYVDNSQHLNASRQNSNMDPRLSTRNKVAFFKQSLVLVRDHDFEIAFKRSELDESFSKLRIIFYVLNKTNHIKNVSV